MKLIDSFVQDLENFLGVPRTKVSLADMWRHSCPDSAKGVELSEYLEAVGLKRKICNIRLLTPLGGDTAILQRRLWSPKGFR